MLTKDSETTSGTPVSVNANSHARDGHGGRQALAAVVVSAASWGAIDGYRAVCVSAITDGFLLGDEREASETPTAPHRAVDSAAEAVAAIDEADHLSRHAPLTWRAAAASARRFVDSADLVTVRVGDALARRATYLAITAVVFTTAIARLTRLGVPPSAAANLKILPAYTRRLVVFDAPTLIVF